MRATINTANIGAAATPDSHPDCRAHLTQIVALYRARGWEDQAKNIVTGGVNRFNADNYKADTIQRQLPFSVAGTLMSSAASPFNKYLEQTKDRPYSVG